MPCMQVALQEQRADNNAAAARQLKLIERLRADKDELSAKCLAAASELKACPCHLVAAAS